MEKKNKHSTTKHAFANRKKHTTTQDKHRKLQPGLVAVFHPIPWRVNCCILRIVYIAPTENIAYNLRQRTHNLTLRTDVNAVTKET